jgi:hypothetical protein
MDSWISGERISQTFSESVSTFFSCIMVTAASWRKLRQVAWMDRLYSVNQYAFHGFAPGLVGTYQDSEGGGGRHRSSPPMNGSKSWRGSLDGRERRLRRLPSERRLARPSATRRRIGQALALRADKCAISPREVVNPEQCPAAQDRWRHSSRKSQRREDPV